jgi:hypothetical protein
MYRNLVIFYFKKIGRIMAIENLKNDGDFGTSNF